MASGPIASVRWQLDPGTPAAPELINDESPSQSKMSWSTDHDAACLEGTTLTFTLEPEVSEPVSLEWGLSASVVSTDPQVEELEVILVVDEK